MTAQTQFDAPYSWCEIQIKVDEDWRDAVVLRQLQADGSEVDMDFSNLARLEMFVRPRFDHNVLIRKLSSDLSAGNELQFTPAAPGQVTISVTRANVIATIPVGTWDQFLVATYSSGFTEELWRGPLIVHPGRLTS